MIRWIILEYKSIIIMLVKYLFAVKYMKNLKCRWSAIAAKLPGRTDNEIKNVWHTHLKKRLAQQDKDTLVKQPVNVIETTEEKKALSSPHCASSDVSTITASTTSDHNTAAAVDHQHQHHLPVKDESLDDDFWSQVFSPPGNSGDATSFPATGGVRSSSAYDNVNFWYDVYMGKQEFGEF